MACGPYRTPAPSSVAGTRTPEGSDPTCHQPRPHRLGQLLPAPPGVAASQTPVLGTSPARTAPPRLLRTTGRAPWCPGGTRRRRGRRASPRPACGKGRRRAQRRGQGPERQPAPTGLTSFPAAHCPRLGRCSPPAAGGRDPGREADPAWPRPGVGPGSGVGPSREGTWKDPGGRLTRLPPRSRLPQSPPASLAARPGGSLEPGMEWGRAGQGWGRRRQGPPPLTGSRRRRRLRASECPLPQGRGAVAPGSRPPVLGPHPRNEPARPPNSQATAPAAARAPAPAPPPIPQARQPRRRQAASQGDRPEQSRAEGWAACAIE